MSLGIFKWPVWLLKSWMLAWWCWCMRALPLAWYWLSMTWCCSCAVVHHPCPARCSLALRWGVRDSPVVGSHFQQFAIGIRIQQAALAEQWLGTPSPQSALSINTLYATISLHRSIWHPWKWACQDRWSVDHPWNWTAWRALGWVWRLVCCFFVFVIAAYATAIFVNNLLSFPNASAVSTLRETIPFNPLVSFNAAFMTSVSGVTCGFVMYWCLKNTVLPTLVVLIFTM